MKFVQFIIFLSIILFIKSANFCNSDITATKPSDCTDLRRSSEYHFCCYFEGTWGGVANKKSCIDLSPVRKDEVINYIEIINKETGYHIDKIICKSIFIKVNFVFLLFLLFL